VADGTPVLARYITLLELLGQWEISRIRFIGGTVLLYHMFGHINWGYTSKNIALKNRPNIYGRYLQ